VIDAADLVASARGQFVFDTLGPALEAGHHFVAGLLADDQPGGGASGGLGALFVVHIGGGDLRPGRGEVGGEGPVELGDLFAAGAAQLLEGGRGSVHLEGHGLVHRGGHMQQNAGVLHGVEAVTGLEGCCQVGVDLGVAVSPDRDDHARLKRGELLGRIHGFSCRPKANAASLDGTTTPGR